MAIKIERALTPEETLLLAPHMRKAERLDRQRDAAQRDLVTVLRVLEPRTGANGFQFDGYRGVWFTEQPDEPAPLIAEVRTDG